MPHIYVGPRRIMFDPYALNHWLEKRNTSTAPRQFEFRSDGRVTWDKSREVPQIDLNPLIVCLRWFWVIVIVFSVLL